MGSYGSLMNTRSRFSSILVGYQNQIPNLFHVAGYAKNGLDNDGNSISVTGRTIEKWWQAGTEFEAEEMIAPDLARSDSRRRSSSSTISSRPRPLSSAQSGTTTTVCNQKHAVYFSTD